jgi:hypothetical protein
MNRGGVNRIKLLAVAGALAIVVIAVVLLSSTGSKSAGSLAAAARLTGGGRVTAIDYKVTGNGIVPVSGSTPVTDSAGVTAIAVKDLPPGAGYLLELSAASADGNVKCTRRSDFDITLGHTTSLEVVLPCRDLGRIAQFVVTRKAAAKVEGGAIAPAPAVEVPPECHECEKTNIASGACEPDSGCDGLDGNDKALCSNLLNCMRATNCWVKDPLDCLCGTVDYVECTRYANGDCKAEMQAATKTTDPIKNGTLFYDPTVPAGRANRLISCDKERCVNHCAL